MSTDADKDTACPNVIEHKANIESIGSIVEESQFNEKVDTQHYKKKNAIRKVSFPDEAHLVTQYFEPANPWQDVPSTTRAQLAAEYLESCRRHRTPPIDSVLQQIRELLESAIGGSARAPRLTLSECLLLGAAPADALEAVLRKTQFKKVEIDHAEIDDEGAEALFDMIEYYESSTSVCISGPRRFGVRGWQAASRLIKKSAELSELEVTEDALEASHAAVLARALRPHSCRLRALCLQRTSLAGEPLLYLVIALKLNTSVRELRLGDNRLTAADAAQLGSLLKYNTTIKLLDLSNNQIQDLGAGYIADALVEQSAQTPPSAGNSPVSPHQCPIMEGYEVRGLAFLVLWNNQLTRNCAGHLSKAVRACQSLCVLNIGRNALGTEVVRALSVGGALESLGLQSARLGPDAARALADLIRVDNRLQRLDLRDNRLGSAGLQAILQAMKENTTLTQIDLDEPVEPITLTVDTSGEEIATVARLTRDIRALCVRNEPRPGGTERRVHRKISLTCHTGCLARGPTSGGEEEPRNRRLRSPAPSPAPSPAGSPIPHTNSRFSVQPVTPDRESSTDSSSPSTPTRTNYCSSTSSRFKVVQVMEPPRIRVQPATDKPRRNKSRFSVTRNYDYKFNPSNTPSPSPSPEPPKISGSTDISKCEIIEPKVSTNEKMLSEQNFALTNVETDIMEPCAGSTVSINKNKTVGVEMNATNATNKQKYVESVMDAAEPVINSNKIETHRDKSDINSSDSCVDDIVKKQIKSESESCFQDIGRQLSHDQNVSVVGNNKVLKTETKIVKNSVKVNEEEKTDFKLEVTLKTESVQKNLNTQLPAKVHCDQNVCNENKLIDVNRESDNFVSNSEKKDTTIKQIETITEDLGNLIQEMKDLTIKTAAWSKKSDPRVKSDCTQTDVIDVNSKIATFNDVPVNFIRDNVVLKKNKSESSLDSPDLEVSRLMNKKLVESPFCDSSSSLEISGSSMESLNDNPQQQIICKPIIIQESIESDTELDRRKHENITLSTESSIESNTSEGAPVNSSNFLNTSVSSNESVSPIIFGSKKLHGSLSSLEASVSSLESAKQEKIMVTSADSGIEYSLQNPSDYKDDYLSNEGTLTNTSTLKNTVKKTDSLQETITHSPKRTSSLLDVPALKTKGMDRIRKISWGAPSSSFQMAKLEPEPVKLPSHLEKLLSLFQHPSSIFSRNTTPNDEERKSASNTPPRKDSSVASSFWSWGGSTDKAEKDDGESPSETNSTADSTLSERVQVSFIDESFSRKLDSKSPSTDTENTLSEFQSYPLKSNFQMDICQLETKGKSEEVTEMTTDDNIVQKTLELSLINIDNASSNGNKVMPRACDTIDLFKPNDLNRNVYDTPFGDNNEICGQCQTKESTEHIQRNELKSLDVKLDDINLSESSRPRSFAAVLKSSSSENSLGKQTSPDTGQSVDKLPSKVIRGIKENISPENTLTSSMTTTNTLAYELSDMKIKKQNIVNPVWEVTLPLLKDTEPKDDQIKVVTELAPIATIEETCDEALDNPIKLDFIDEIKSYDEKNISIDSGVTSLGSVTEENKKIKVKNLSGVDLTTEMGNVDFGKDALCYLMYENQDFEPGKAKIPNVQIHQSSLAQELKDAEIKEQFIDLSPELIIDEAKEVPKVFAAKESRGRKSSPVIPERAKLKKCNSLEDLSQSANVEQKHPKTKTIVFNLHDIPSTTPRDIPERRNKLRTRSGSSPKSLPESLNKPCPLSKMDSILFKKKKKVSSLGKIARDSLLALNMSEEEIAEFRRSYKLTSVESLRSLESVSEDANSQSGNSIDSRCMSCLRTSQESLMSLDSINEDCRCADDCDAGNSAR